MANDIANVLKLEGDIKLIQEIFSRIQNDEDGIGSIDFNKIIPMPNELDITEGYWTDKGIDLYLTSLNPYMDHFGNKKLTHSEFNNLLNLINKSERTGEYTGKLSPSEAKKLNEIESMDLMKIGKQAVNNVINYGAKSWYGWCINNWGSKWNAYECAGSDDTLYFDTANTNVSPIVKKLSEMYPTIHFKYRWADEDIGYNTGEKTFLNGNEEKCYIPIQGSKEAYELASEIREYDLSESYIFDEKSNTYKYIEDIEEDEENTQKI